MRGPDLRAVWPEATAAHRQRLATLLGSPRPDRYWSRAVAHQGEGLNKDAMAGPQFASLILLLVLPSEVVGLDAVRYGGETCWPNIREHAPPGLLPFADDTGGNLWACDGRARRRDPAIVCIDPELAGDDAIFPVAPRFDAFGDARGRGLIAIAARHRRVLMQRAGRARWGVTPLPVANYCRLDSSRP